MIGRRIQNYKVLSLLGEGGMGTVYKVIDTQLERYAALKILNLNSTINSSFVERFKREARNQAKLSHPNIVSVYGFVQEKDVLGIAMEYIEGDTIESIINDSGRIEFSYACELMEQILNGIAAAHDQGFIHRDLKPSNIILDLNGNPKIMDFGISKSIDELKSITQQNTRPGTLLYMSPEQLSGNNITVKSDLYSLGVTFYEMLSGTHPYKAETIYEIIDAHVNRLPDRISSYVNTIPYQADEIILRAMNKSSQYNFNSASDFRNELIELRKLDLPNGTDNYLPDNILDETEKSKSEKSLKGFQKVSNILLLIIFIGLAVIVFNVVKSILSDENEILESNSLSYSQDYSKNPNYLSSSDWELVRLDIDYNLNSLIFVNDYKGFIAGDSGSLFSSVDGGISWKQIKSNFNNNFNSFANADDRTFVVGSEGFIAYLNNKTQIKKINSNSTDTFFKIYFLDPSSAFIVGGNGAIYSSYDGGLTWNKIQSNITENLFSICFSDPQNGVIVGWNGTVLKTEDSGLSWQKADINTKSYLKDVLFVNEFLGFIIGGEGKLFRTENGGDDWDELEIDTDAGLYKISFFNNENGMILSNRGDVFISNDAGKNWIKKNVGRPVALNDINKLNTGNYIVVGNNGNVFRSKLTPK